MRYLLLVYIAEADTGAIIISAQAPLTNRAPNSSGRACGVLKSQQVDF